MGSIRGAVLSAVAVEICEQQHVTKGGDISTSPRRKRLIHFEEWEPRQRVLPTRNVSGQPQCCAGPYDVQLARLPVKPSSVARIGTSVAVSVILFRSKVVTGTLFVLGQYCMVGVNLAEICAPV